MYITWCQCIKIITLFSKLTHQGQLQSAHYVSSSKFLNIYRFVITITSFLHTEKIKIDKIFPHGRQGPSCLADIVNSLWPSDAIWRHRSGSTLAQVMACCLMAPSHHLNQFWLIISKVEWHSSKGNFTGDTSAISHWNYLKNQVPKMSFKFPRDRVNTMAATNLSYWPSLSETNQDL